jgi:hypothetical protein
MTTEAADVLADPVGLIVDLVASVERALDQTAITTVVTRVAGGRARQRRLARCLAGRPSVLTDGRSPASEAAGDLLIALRRAGAVSISLPACAACGKQLRSMRRRGQDWYCTACGRRSARCASCGQDRPTATVDRQGRPRCRQCPDDDDRDPVEILTGVITRLEPSLPAERIAAATWRAQPAPAKLRQLAWAIEDTPGPADRRRSTRAHAGRAAADRRVARRRSPGHHPSGVPAVRSGHPAGPADRRAMAVP